MLNQFLNFLLAVVIVASLAMTLITWIADPSSWLSFYWVSLTVIATYAIDRLQTDILLASIKRG